MSKDAENATGATDDQKLQSTGNDDAATDDKSTDDDKSIDWEAKYKEAVAQSRKWEKLANSDHKKAEAATGAKDDAESRAAALQKELDELKAEKVRSLLIAEIAKEKEVDVDILGRMTGDDREAIEANAEMLTGLSTKGNSYPKVKDKGESKTPSLTKEEILAIKNPSERRKAMAQNLSLFN